MCGPIGFPSSARGAAAEVSCVLGVFARSHPRATPHARALHRDHIRTPHLEHERRQLRHRVRSRAKPACRRVRDSAVPFKSTANARPDSRRADARSVPPADTGRPTGPGSSSSRKTITTRGIPSTATTPPASTAPSSTRPQAGPRGTSAPSCVCARAFPIPPSPPRRLRALLISLPPSASRRRFLPLPDRHAVPSPQNRLP